MPLAARGLRLAIISLAVLLLTACDAVDSLRHGLAHSEAVAEDLEGRLGSKPFVGFNWHNGQLQQVTVLFEELPQGHELPVIVEQARDAVETQFEQTPQQIIVSFALAP